MGNTDLQLPVVLWRSVGSLLVLILMSCITACLIPYIRDCFQMKQVVSVGLLVV